MKTITTLLLSIAGLACVAAPALADNQACTSEPRDKWLPLAEATRKVEALGYTVHAIDGDEGCYEVSGLDKNGAKVELHLDPVTGDVSPVSRTDGFDSENGSEQEGSNQQ